jgi:hypothetical protein
LRIQDMASRGGMQPKVVRDFVNRSTRPDSPPLTYREGRDFASNASRLSVDEAGRMTPGLKREVGAFAKAMNRANEAAARRAGVGDQYTSAMKEYRNAARMRTVAEAAKKAGVKAAAGTIAAGAVGAGGYKAAKHLGVLP